MSPCRCEERKADLKRAGIPPMLGRADYGPLDVLSWTAAKVRGKLPPERYR